MENAFKIEKNIKIPTRVGKWDHLFGKMAVGDSFAVGRDKTRASTMVSASYAYGARHKMSFAHRKVESGIFRIWRTK